MVSTPEVVDSVDTHIFADRRITIEDISEQLGISVGTIHKLVYEVFAFSTISCRLISTIQEQRQQEQWKTGKWVAPSPTAQCSS